MRLLYSNLKKGKIKLKVTNPEDLWYLSQIIEKGDIISGKTIRKLKKGEEKRVKISKVVFLKIEVEKIRYNKDNLRVNGKIIDCPDDIQKGAYHTFNIEVNTIITLTKKIWHRYYLDRIKEACKDEEKILICVLDRSEAIFALLKKHSYEILSQLKGDVPKKDISTKPTKNFYVEIINKLEFYIEKYKTQRVVVASPSFWKEELMKIVDDNLKSKIILASCSTLINGINEILKRPELKEALKQSRIAKELSLMELFLEELAKDDLAIYGLKETEYAINMGAVKILLITDTLIQKSREEGWYKRLNNLMKSVEKMKGSICIISSQNEAGKKLSSLGNIGAILRFKIRKI